MPFKERVAMQYLILVYVVLCVHVGICTETRVHYFAYGSNLFKNRMHINVPTAEFYTTAFLQDYSLGFQTVAPLWNGAVATIYEDPGATVWGAIWLIDYEGVKKLDEQEGVDNLLYHAINVSVTSLAPLKDKFTARTYVQNKVADKLLPGRFVPCDRRPSITYREVIICGAKEVGLPKDYLALLLKIPHNGKLAGMKIRQTLGERFVAGKIST